LKLNKKKELAARTLKVGKGRIVFNKERLSEIKEAITKQDIRELLRDKAIIIKEIRGSRKTVKRKTRRRAGSIKQPKKKKKREYIIITRKLRAYLSGLKEGGIITRDDFWQLRKEIRSREFKSKASLKDRVNQMLRGRKE